MSTSLVTQQPKELAEWKSPTQIKMRVQAIQQLMSEVLKPGTKENEFSGDYGIIPGTGSKPSLWKSGSEQILAMFEIAVDPVVEDLSTDDCFRYRVTTRLTHAPSGNFLGAGIGEASSDETKYKWRKTYNKKEFDATPVDRRRLKYSQYKDSNGMWVDKEEMQVRTEPADLANTILKMAKKRSQIDATLTVTGASSMFDQDLEDMTDEQKQQMEDNRQSKGRKTSKPASEVKCPQCNAIGGHLPSCPTRKQAPKTEDVICGACGKKNGHEPECQHAAKNAQGAAPVAQGKAVEGQVVSKAQESTPGLTKAAVQILKIDHLLKKADAKGVQEPYVRLLVVGTGQNSEFPLYLWHKTPQEYFTDAKVNKFMVCEYKPMTQAGKFSLEKVLELDGCPFVDNKPAPAQGTIVDAEEPF